MKKSIIKKMEILEAPKELIDFLKNQKDGVMSITETLRQYLIEKIIKSSDMKSINWLFDNNLHFNWFVTSASFYSQILTACRQSKSSNQQKSKVLASLRALVNGEAARETTSAFVQIADADAIIEYIGLFDCESHFGIIHSKFILNEEDDALLAFSAQIKNTSLLFKTTLYFAQKKNAGALYHLVDCFESGSQAIAAIFLIGDYDVIEKLYKNNKISAEEFALSMLIGEKDELLIKYAIKTTEHTDQQAFLAAVKSTVNEDKYADIVKLVF